MQKIVIYNIESGLPELTYDGEIDLTSNVRSSAFSSHLYYHIAVDLDLDISCSRLVHNEELDTYEVIIDPNLVEEKKQNDKKSRIAIKYQEMDLDILNEMKQICNTTKPESALTDYNKYKEMLEDPQFFVNKGLLNSEGNELDSEESVTVFAQSKINDLKLFSIYRDKRIAQFLQEQQEILSE